jgi:EAL and modified HD-GYP domain-containing signal transduction protein
MGADSTMLKTLSQLSQSGYSFALQDFNNRDEFRPLAELAQIVKLDIRSTDRESLAKQVEMLRSLKVSLLASGVETHEDYQYAKSLGFDYFEGFFFCRPQYSDGRTIPPNRLSSLRLLSTLQNPEVNLDELEEAVAQDVSMTHRILRYLNSPMNGLPRKIDSIRHAITLIGTNLIRQWASVIWLQGVEEKPRELMVMSLIRANACKQLAFGLGLENKDQFFTVGLLSLLDALIDQPMNIILQDLPLIDPVKDAILHRSGTMGAALDCVEAYERCDWSRTSCADTSDEVIRESYLTSVGWARAVLSALAN